MKVAVGNPELSERLNEVASRVNAVGRAYERLAYINQINFFITAVVSVPDYP
jgi:hypothetical protein